MNVLFRELGSFPSDPDELAQALARLEGNIADSFAQAGKLSLPVPVPTDAKVASATAVGYAAKLGELVTTDTTAASMTVRLPDASAQNAGQEVAVIRRSAANTLTVSAASTNVQGAAAGDAAPAATGLYVYVSTGRDWWRR